MTDLQPAVMIAIRGELMLQILGRFRFFEDRMMLKAALFVGCVALLFLSSGCSSKKKVAQNQESKAPDAASAAPASNEPASSTPSAGAGDAAAADGNNAEDGQGMSGGQGIPARPGMLGLSEGGQASSPGFPPQGGGVNPDEGGATSGGQPAGSGFSFPGFGILSGMGAGSQGTLGM